MHNLLDKTFRDKDGHLAIMQLPNVWLWIWIVTIALQFFVKAGPGHTLIVAISAGTLLVWAALEAISGVDYFRRALGIVVFVYVVTEGIIRLLHR
ncbi:hypothetical protein HJC99_06160 [Candidatus Saccharibacteria bacterium]|nr:hypothetical protein [Candidatus Saccharibacteria bacterium]